MKYLFLDIDGVLNHEEWYLNRCHNKKYDDWWETCFDPLCVERVNRILKETGASLVVSSSWKVDKHLSEMFERVGLPTSFDITPNIVEEDEKGNISWPMRGEEIDEFLKDHPCDNYVIVDDDTDFTDDQKENHFVHCCAILEQAYKEGHIGETGLSELKMNDILNILNK